MPARRSKSATSPSPTTSPSGSAELRLGYDEPAETVTLTLVSTGEDAPEVTHRMSSAQLGAAARVAVAAVLAGRPRCPRCGLAMDPEGHPCPLGNGDLRGHRP